MNEPMHGALAGVIDRCASATEPEPSFFGRIPEEVQPRRDLRAGPKLLLTVLDWFQRQFGRIDATDPQLAERCGVSVNTISNWLKQLEVAGLIERVGRTFRRVIRLLFRFKSTSTTPKTGGNLPTEPGESTPKTVGGHPTDRGKPPQEPGYSPKSQRDKRDKGPAASSSPASGGTPPPARTKTADTPPSPARPPLIETREREAAEAEARDAALRARWDELPPADRAAIEAEVRAADPVLAGFAPMFRAACLTSMEGRPGVSPETSETRCVPAIVEEAPAVEVLPTDRELGSLKFLADATNPFMRAFARIAIRDAGRDDLIDPQSPEREPAGQPPKGLPAGS